MNGMYTQKPEKPKFMDLDEIKAALKSMEHDNGLNTADCYSSDDILHSNLISFREKHLTYLQTHPKVNPQQYLKNLRTKVRIR